MSRSSFAWWGAYLSNAKEIYYPIPINGVWGEENIRTDADFKVNEKRYIYVSQKERKIIGGYEEAVKIFQKAIDDARAKKEALRKEKLEKKAREEEKKRLKEEANKKI